MSTTTILDRIMATKREEVAAAKQAMPAAELVARLADAPPVRDFAGALRRPGLVALIAEVKKASPSAGLIRAGFDPVEIATCYQQAGAAACSVLTDATYFQGSPAYLQAIRAVTTLPLLRKDFVCDRYQLLEARAWGADAALLIVAVLTDQQLADLSEAAAEIGLAVLVEVHTAEETDRAVAAGAKLIGINNRDLKVFHTDLQTTVALRDRIPGDRIVVSESGIRDPQDVELMAAHGVDAVLVGEALMRQDDLRAATARLVRAGQGRSR